MYRTSNGHKFNSAPYPELDCERIWDAWIVSDTHFWHIPKTWNLARPIDWQDLLVERWNNVVDYGDTVLHLGDLSFGNKALTYEIMRNLKGRIFMLKGNHDRRSVGWFDDVGVTLIKKSFALECPEMDTRIVFSHRKVCDLPKGTINIHGHIHEKGWFITEMNGSTYINASVEKTDLRPVRLDSLLKRAENLHFSRLVI